MLKKYLSLFAACFMSVALSAQNLVVLPVEGAVIPLTQQHRLYQGNEEFATWGYCEDNVVYSIGVNDEVELSAAIFVPRSALGAYQNAKVAGVRVGLASASTRVSAFLKEGNDLYAKNKLTTEVTPSAGVGFHDLMFRVPYQIAGDLIVGYTATGFNQIGYDGGKSEENANFICINGEWGSIYKTALKQGWGSMCIQLLLTGDQLPTADMAIESVLTRNVEQNKPFEFKGVVSNKTTSVVENYEITCTFSGHKPIVHQIAHRVKAVSADTFSISMDGIGEIGKLPAEVVVSKVNGQADENPKNNVLVHSLNVVEEGCYFLRKVVAEEATSTLCGYCPTGIVVFESMKKRFPDQFIGIAVHMDVLGPDPMICEDYLQLGYLIEEGLPNGIVDRKYDMRGNPMFFENYYEKEIQNLADAKVTIRSVSEVKNNSIHIDVATRFAKDTSGAQYKLAFVLLEHKVSGYTQTNYFSGRLDDPMGGFEQLPKHVEMDFNDVARGIWDFYGMPNTIPSAITKKVDYEYAYDMPLPREVQNPANLEVVVMLMDADSGDIIQADKLAVGKTASIESVSGTDRNWNLYAADGRILVEGDEYESLQVYALDGSLLHNGGLPAGIYIARVVAGHKMYTQKVVVE